jgi:hypothetical protein
LAVALDQQSTGGDGTHGRMQQVTWNTTTNTKAAFINITAGATFFAVEVEVEKAAPGTLTMHWDSTGTNQLMTQIGTTQAAGGSAATSVALFGLVSPTAGSNTISWSATGGSGSTGGYIAGTSWTGTETSSVAAAIEGFASANNGGATSTPASVTTAVSIPLGDVAIGVFGANGVAFTGTYSAGGTSIDEDGTGTDGASAARWSGAGSTITATSALTGNANWAAAVVGLKVPSGGDTFVNAMQMFQV